MCGRIVQALSPELISEVLKVREVNLEAKPNYNLGPKQLAGVVQLNPKTKTRALNELQWGLVPSWEAINHKSTTFNARSEDLANKKMFRDAWRSGRRCLIPINAYYEWKKEGRSQRPYAIGRKDKQLITLAGLWEQKVLENGDILKTFTVITAEARGQVSYLHERIPVMVEEADRSGWLGEVPIDAATLLHPPESNILEFWPVDRAVGNVRNNHSGLLVRSDDEETQLKLI